MTDAFGRYQTVRGMRTTRCGVQLLETFIQSREVWMLLEYFKSDRPSKIDGGTWQEFVVLVNALQSQSESYGNTA